MSWTFSITTAVIYTSTKSLKSKGGLVKKQIQPAMSRLVPKEQLQYLKGEQDNLSNQVQQIFNFVNLQNKIEEKKSLLALLETLLMNEQQAVSGTRKTPSVRSTNAADHIPDFSVLIIWLHHHHNNNHYSKFVNSKGSTQHNFSCDQSDQS